MIICIRFLDKIEKNNKFCYVSREYNIFCVTKFLTKANQKTPQKRAASNPSRLTRRESDRVRGLLLIGFASASIVVLRAMLTTLPCKDPKSVDSSLCPISLNICLVRALASEFGTIHDRSSAV